MKSHFISVNPVHAAVDKLAAQCDHARCHQHLFSFEMLRSWRELEREVETKLEDIEQMVDEDEQRADEIAIARVNELTRAVQALLDRNAETRVQHLMTSEIQSCRPDDRLNRVAELMWNHDCGALPVVDDSGNLVGIITDRDAFMAAYTQGRRLDECSVASAMSSEVYSCAPDDSLVRAVELMRDYKFRRVPVTDANGELVGVLSLADIARHLDTLPSEHPLRALLVPALAAISERRAARPDDQRNLAA